MDVARVTAPEAAGAVAPVLLLESSDKGCEVQPFLKQSKGRMPFGGMALFRIR